MKHFKIFTLTLVLLIGVVGCKKTGDFTTDKSVYTQGDVITTSNTTKKTSEFYKWTFGGIEVVADEPIYTIPDNTPVGTFEISMLPVNNLNVTDSWKRTSRYVNIEEAEKGKIIFFLPTTYFTSGASDEEATITINGESKTIIIYSSYPSCESNNNLFAATFDNLKSGDHDYIINGSSSNSSYYLSGSIEVEDGFDCRIINITDL